MPWQGPSLMRFTCVPIILRYTPEQQEALVCNVFLTGGNMNYPGVKERVERELLAMRPFQSHFKVWHLHKFHPILCFAFKKRSKSKCINCSLLLKNIQSFEENLPFLQKYSLPVFVFVLQVTLASQPTLDAWRGARQWALEHPPTGTGPASEGWISRQDYEEKGGEYLSEHWASNLFVPVRLSKPAPSRPTEQPVAMSATTDAASAGAATITTTQTAPSLPVSAAATVVAS